jgi:hypothetical protein
MVNNASQMNDPKSYPAPQLISASRRCDIPRFYGRWFARRRKEGYAEFRTAFGVRGRVSLATADVLGYVFWTRDARPFRAELAALRDGGTAYAFQFTINGYGRELEPHRPNLQDAIESFRELSGSLPGPEAIQWRYDPIVLSEAYPPDYHLRQFRRIARQLAGHTQVVNVSVVEPYIKAVRRIADRTVRYRAVDPRRHKSVAKRYPGLQQATEAPQLLGELSAVAAEQGIELRVCCNPEYSRPDGPLAPSQCIGPGPFVAYGAGLHARLSELAPAPSRAACRCVRSVDIGMDNTCPCGCKYCYVTTSLETAIENFRRHDPTSPSLR